MYRMIYNVLLKRRKTMASFALVAGGVMLLFLTMAVRRNNGDDDVSGPTHILWVLTYKIKCK